jgi:UDP-2,3-diacylglucosamine pyrophosphatase LpxH
MKLIWLTDLHLEFLTPGLARAFIAEVVAEKPHAVLITGDISNARGLEYHLGMLAESLRCNVYFELGNHDFYLGSLAQVDALAQKACTRHSNLIHLGHREIVRLNKEATLVGHLGWADGRAGAGSRSTVRLNDHELIADFRQLDSQGLFALLNQLGDESARYISKITSEALKTTKTLLIATHVPSFIEAALYENKPSEPDYAPHFVNIAMGRAILDLAHHHPDRNFVVLCGHTHHPALYSPAPNVKVKVAGAQYHAPAIAEILRF